MNPKKNLILLLILIVAGGAYYFYDVKRAGEKEARKERKAKVLKGADTKLLMRISLERKKEPYQMIRTEKGWKFVKPVDAPVDEEVMEGILKAAAALKAERWLGKPGKPKEYGLENPKYKFTFGLKGQADVSLKIGDLTPTGQYWYASLKNGVIFTLPSRSLRAFEKSVFELRDRSILDILPEKTQKIRVEPEGGTPFTVVRRSKERWDVVEPVQDKADLTDTEGVVSDLKYGEVHRFVVENPKAADLVKYGLDKPSYRIRLFTDKKGKETDGLIIGKSTVEEVLNRQGKKEKKKFFYARRLSGGPVMLIENSTVKDMPKRAFALRNKTFIDYDVDHVTRLKLETPEETIDIRRLAKKKWDMRVTKAGGKREKPVGRHKHIDDVLWDIKWSNAVEYVDTPPKDLARYGLAKRGGPDAVRRVSVWIKERKKGKDGKETVEPEKKKAFIIGPLLPSKKAYGRMEGEKRLFAVKSEDYRKIFRDSFYLSDRRLLHIDEEENINRVTAVFPGGKELLFRRSGEKWVLEKPTDRVPINYRLNDLISALSDFEHVGEAEAGAKYDFGKFRVRVRLEHKNGTKLPPITVAASDSKEFLYVRKGKDTRVWKVKKKDVDSKLPKSIEEFTDKKKEE